MRYNHTIVLRPKPGRLDIIRDTLSRLLIFGHSKMRVAPHLASIRRNVPDNHALHGSLRLKPYQVNSHNLDKIQPVENDRKLFTSSATYVFMSTVSEKLRQAQHGEFGPYFEYLSVPKKHPPSSKSRTFMSYYIVKSGAFYKVLSLGPSS